MLIIDSSATLEAYSRQLMRIIPGIRFGKLNKVLHAETEDLLNQLADKISNDGLYGWSKSLRSTDIRYKELSLTEKTMYSGINNKSNPFAGWIDKLANQGCLRIAKVDRKNSGPVLACYQMIEKELEKHYGILFLEELEGVKNGM